LVHEAAWHNLDVGEVFRRQETDSGGLTVEEAENRIRKFGPNQLEGEGETDKLTMLYRQVKNPLNAVLAAASLISFAAGKNIDTVVILLIIAFNASMGFIQEYRAERALQALMSMTSPEAEVLRRDPRKPTTSLEMRVKASNIVPGDIILLDAGDKVPADARIFEAANFEIDEAMLTGESVPVRKTADTLPIHLEVADRKNVAYSGTIVTHGRGRAVVFATGLKTEIGKIATLISETEETETPIQRRTRDLSKKLGVYALLASSITLAVGLLRGFDLYEILLFALASAVSAIPEGLLVVMTITLAVGAHRMVKRNALIRKLQAVETLGSVTTICTDKTGTLTTNQMTVTEIVAGAASTNVTGVGYVPEGEFSRDGKIIVPKEDEHLNLLLEAASLCNDSKLRRHEVDSGFRWEVIGDPTEGSLVVAGAKAGIVHEDLTAQMPRVDEIPFDAKRRFMATFHKSPGNKVTAFVKGAPETVLDMCASIALDGREEAMTSDHRDMVLAHAARMASEAKRVLAIGYQEEAHDSLSELKERIEEKAPTLVFLGLVGMIDPPRREAREAVALCKTAGIRVKMLTGDHKLTAEAIAKQIGITGMGEVTLTGEDVHHMSDDELDRVILQTAVFARVSPTHKHRIVESLRRQGQIVAMTGDGVNDAPALKAAEVGVSMGITGTDVTKETAEMVLADDNFATIVNAVEEGRVVFENIRKVVKYLISTNTAEIITILTALIIFSGAPLILTPIMILWINLVTDGLLDKTLALEPKEGDVMHVPPKSPDAKLIDATMIQNVIVLGIFMAIGTLWLFSRELEEEGIGSARTIAFVTMAMFQVFNSINCRSRTKSIFKIGLFTNRYLLLAIFASFFLNFLATSVPAMQVALGTVALSAGEWASVILVSSSILVVDEIRKFVWPLVGASRQEARMSSAAPARQG
jgi:Ca2+-transporting ATPase